jgi:hypothetical protein
VRKFREAVSIFQGVENYGQKYILSLDSRWPSEFLQLVDGGGSLAGGYAKAAANLFC